MNIFRTAYPFRLRVARLFIRRSIMVFCFLFSFTPLIAQAEIYKHINKDGSVEYTDTPSANAKPVILPKITIWHQDQPLPIPVTGHKKENNTNTPQNVLNYQSLKFVSPQNNSAFYATNGEVSVSVRITPSLQSGDQIQFLVDGQLALTTSSTHATLKGLNRGTHQFSAKIIDKSGKALFLGSPITVTIHKPSILLHRK